MNWRIIGTLVTKDLTLFFRNRFFAFVTVAGLLVYIAIYFASPRSVDETLALGLYAPNLPPIFSQFQQAQGIDLENFDSEDALRDAVTKGDFPAGIVLPEGFLEELMGGNQIRVDVFFGPDAPTELEGSAVALIQQYAYLLSGQNANVEINRQVLGPDLIGQQIPPRDRLLPLIAAFTMLTETLGMASLLSEEIVGRTLRALLVTPLTVGGIFVAKGITGAGLAFVQAAAFLVATGSLSRHPLLLTLALLLGAVLVTGVGFLLGSLEKDLISVMAWGIPALIILSIPAFGVMFPGTISNWVKIIPSYYLTDALHKVANFGASWRDVWSNLVILLGFDLLFIILGVAVLRRKFS
jgi:ABC-type multidrug transport system permease subunit